MKALKTYVPIAGTLLLAALLWPGCKENKPAAAEFKTDEQKVSYVIGANIGRQMKQDHFNADADLIAKGVQDAMQDRVKMTPDEMRTVMMAFQQKIRAQREAEVKALGEKNAKLGGEFLAHNKTQPGVQVTASGLQYQIITQGQGKSPKPTDTVSLNYRAMLIDGTEFDNTEKRGHSMITSLRSVLPGWLEALQLMKEGDKWKLFIPANLGFGGRALNPQVGPNSTLIYEMELVAVNPPQPTTPMAPNGRNPFQGLPPGLNLPPGVHSLPSPPPNLPPSPPVAPPANAH